jgi:hypothetical protein
VAHRDGIAERLGDVADDPERGPPSSVWLSARDVGSCAQHCRERLDPSASPAFQLSQSIQREWIVDRDLPALGALAG